MIYQPSCQGVTIVSPSPPVGGTPCKLSTLLMRSPSNQGMKRDYINMDNWIQETCFMPAETSGPDEPNHLKEAWNHHSPYDNKK